MTGTQKAHFQALLSAIRQELLREIYYERAQLQTSEGVHHPFDRAQDATQRIEVEDTVRRFSRTLSDVNDALRAISEGRYGKCIKCGESISLKRLVVIPWASCCAACQELMEELEPMCAAGAPGAGAVDGCPSGVRP